MRLKITAKPGEIESRGDDLIHALEALIKAKTGKTDDHEGTELLIPVLRQGKTRGMKQFDRIRKVALDRMMVVLAD